MVNADYGRVNAVEASRSHCQPPSVRLKIDFDLQFGPSFSEKYQKYEQH
jgi:hypothetical protein